MTYDEIYEYFETLKAEGVTTLKGISVLTRPVGKIDSFHGIVVGSAPSGDLIVKSVKTNRLWQRHPWREIEIYEYVPTNI